MRRPRRVIDGGSFVARIFRGVRAGEVVEASGSILYRNFKIEAAGKGRSLNLRPVAVSFYDYVAAA